MWAHFPPRELREEGSTPVGDTTLASWMSLKGEVDNALGDLEHSYEQVSATHEKIPVGG